MYKARKTQISKIQFETVLLILNTFLLGIWAVKETIALRNILLVLGTLLTIYYFKGAYKRGLLQTRLYCWEKLPLVMIFLVFAWVLLHYFYFSIDGEAQLKELKSTWLRAFSSVIIGFGCGLILTIYPKKSYILWLGIFLSFLCLFYQYIPRAISLNKLLIPDYFNYLFHLKINTVLMGTILIAGVSGNFFDYLSSKKYSVVSQEIWYFTYWLFINLLILWSFVYIVDSRSGIGLFIVLNFFWFTCALFLLVKRRQGFNFKTQTSFFLVAVILLFIIPFFTINQIKLNAGWKSFFDDLIIAVQIEKYQNWQNLERPYPVNNSGQTVNASNYERVALATAGAKAIFHYPIGVGLLANPFTVHPNAPKKMLTGPKIATHSGWIELGLAFGIPILAFIFIAMTFTFLIVLKNDPPNKMLILNLIVIFAFLYAVGEVAIDHGLEILFYFLGFISAVPFLISRNQRLKFTHRAQKGRNSIQL